MNIMTIYHYLFIGLLLFLIGLLGSVLLKSVIKILISIEFMLLGVNINFITFATYCDNINYEGYIISLFYIHCLIFQQNPHYPNGCMKQYVYKAEKCLP